MDPPPIPGEHSVSICAKVVYYTWKLCSVLFSHLVMITLVVAYCVLGAVTFEKLEAENEREVKKNISQIRANTTDSIWRMSLASTVFDQRNWTDQVINMLQDMESSLLIEMKVRGWDGNESLENIQWTFTGALFYSIIVITTIGYGHIAPKTQSGKVVTIFYAILGIPLMLFCLSHIGDVMASSFRFLYWRVCCYVCTRPPKRRRRRRRRNRYRSKRLQDASTLAGRKSVLGRGSSMRLQHQQRAHSDTECRYRDSGYGSSFRMRRQRSARNAPPRPRSQPPTYRKDPVIYDDYWRRTKNHRGGHSRFNQEDFPRISLPLQDLEAALQDLKVHQMKRSSRTSEFRSKSLPRPPPPQGRMEAPSAGDGPPVSSLYEMDDVDYHNYKERRAMEESEKKRRGRDYDLGYDPEDEEAGSPEWRIPYRRARSELNEPRGTAPVEWAQRRSRLRRLHTFDGTVLRRQGSISLSRSVSPNPPLPAVDANRYYDEDSEGTDAEAGLGRIHRDRHIAQWTPHHSESYMASLETINVDKLKPVPIWLCVFLVASYIVAGTFLFKRWEGWAYLDAAYFCFITLTTIGFGDFVPAQGRTDAATTASAVHSIALCSLYLLFGISLLAMSFNLVQEEVRANVASLATKLGIIKSEEPPESESESY